jgi:hypothetical protein
MKNNRKFVTIKVPGHWVIPDTPGRRAYYVKPYKYRRKSNKGIKRKKKIAPHGPPKGYALAERIEVSEPEGQVRYVYKIEALVEYQGKYLVSFSMDRDLRGQKAIEYYHTHFEPSIEAATIDFHEQMNVIAGYEHIITYLAIDLYRVAGEGKITERNWKLLKSFDDPSEV